MKKSYIYVISIIVVIIGIFSINRSNVFSVVKRQVLNSLGVYTEEVKSNSMESSNYNKAGSFKLDKSTEWNKYGTARVSLDINSIVKTGSNYKDIILLIPSKASMDMYAKYFYEDSKELIDYLLTDSNNRISIVSYNDTKTTVLKFTNDKDSAMKFVSSITYQGNDSYNAGLAGTKEALNGYTKTSDRDVITLFLTFGFALNEGSEYMVTYNTIKSEYPGIKFYGIMYGLIENDFNILDDLEKFTDKIWETYFGNPTNVLLEAAVDPDDYEKFILNYYINNDYFTVEDKNDIVVGMGEVSLEEENGQQKVVWNLSNANFYTGGNTNMTVDLKLKDQYLNVSNYYPLDEKVSVTSKVYGDKEITSSSNSILVLKNMYQVIYDVNAPDGCEVDSTDPISYGTFQNVMIDNEALTCDGYLFKGYKILDEDKTDITMVNDDVFLMPTHDVTIRAIWAKPTIIKSMSGTVYEKPTLYRTIAKKPVGEYSDINKYNGNHQDSIDGVGNKTIYYYNLNKNNNVLFADFCWKIVRTTDTGGVKLIYNGIADSEGKCGTDRENNLGYSPATKTMSSSYYYGTDYTYNENTKMFSLTGNKMLSAWSEAAALNLIGKYTCLSSNANDTCSELHLITGYHDSATSDVLSLNFNSTYEQFGQLGFNLKWNSLAYAGYMYNKVYISSYKTLLTDDALRYSALSTTYWYADSVTYDGSKYSLVNPYKVSSSKDYSSLAGKYTFFNTSSTYTASSVSYISGVHSSSSYYVLLSNGKDISDSGTKYTYGESYYSGIWSARFINDPTTIDAANFYDERDKLVGKYVCKNADSYNSCTALWYVVAVSENKIFYNSINNVYKFSTGITTSDNSQYTLDGDSVDIWEFNDANVELIKNHRYTCFNSTGTCDGNAFQIYRFDKTAFYYLKVNDNKTLSTRLSEMLNADDVNVTDSVAKLATEAWYEKNLKNYTSYLEDVIYCNDRSIKDIAGWDEESGDFTTYLKFKQADSTKDLSCENVTDQFSVKNNKAKLKYPVGMLTKAEIQTVVSNRIRDVSSFSTMTPTYLKDYILNMEGVFISVYTSGIYGSLLDDFSNTKAGLRPVISLRPDIEYTTGDGTADNPYVIDTSS